MYASIVTKVGYIDDSGALQGHNIARISMNLPAIPTTFAACAGMTLGILDPPMAESQGIARLSLPSLAFPSRCAPMRLGGEIARGRAPSRVVEWAKWSGGSFSSLRPTSHRSVQVQAAA